MVTVLCTSGMSHSGRAVARQTAGDSCRQLQRESKLQRQCFQTAGLQMSQWRPSRSVEQEPMGLIVGHSWSACLNSVKSPRQTEATHSLCVTHCPPDRPSCHIGHELKYVLVCSQFRGLTSDDKNIISSIDECKKRWGWYCLKWAEKNPWLVCQLKSENQLILVSKDFFFSAKWMIFHRLEPLKHEKLLYFYSSMTVI